MPVMVPVAMITMAVLNVLLATELVSSPTITTNKVRPNDWMFMQDKIRIAALDAALAAMPKKWRERWCGSGLCACLGCSNRAGTLASMGFTRDEWKERMIAVYNFDPDNPPIEILHPRPAQYKNPVCKGSFKLGNACGRCEKCTFEAVNIFKAGGTP